MYNAETRHFLDSAQLFDYCKNLNGNIVDFGSGAGFPGAVLSILGVSKIFLIESSKKKCNFLKIDVETMELDVLKGAKKR